MFGPLALVPVWQEHYQTRELSPLFPAGGDELVHGDLCGVDEISELGLPQHQGATRRDTESVLEPQDRHLGEWRVVNLEAGASEVGEWPVLESRLRVVQNQMSMAEGSALRVLAREANGDPLAE